MIQITCQYCYGKQDWTNRQCSICGMTLNHKCPVCGAECDATDRFCKNCKTIFYDCIKCPNCGEPLLLTDKVCKACGKKQTKNKFSLFRRK